MGFSIAKEQLHKVKFDWNKIAICPAHEPVGHKHI